MRFFAEQREIIDHVWQIGWMAREQRGALWLDVEPSRYGRVLGVAVTGADDMYKASQTEEHGIVPISYVALLK